MQWALFLSAGKSLWSLLVAAALIWSGIALTANPPPARAGHSNATETAVVLIETEEVEDGGRDSGLAANAPPSSSVPRSIVNPPQFFDATADYSILTGYGNPSEVLLSDFLTDGVSTVTFSLSSCDESRADYYRSVVVENGRLKLESNTLGHVHGSSTQTQTVCTVAAAGDGGNQNREFSLYTVSDRTPAALPPGALTVSQARSDEIDVQVDVPGSSLGYLRLGWRVSGSSPSFAVAHGVNADTVLTLTGLQPDTTYEIRAYLMTAQAFDLYRASNSGLAGTLIAEGNPESRWISNLTGAGLGKSLSISQATPPAPPPVPETPPDPTPEATLSLSPRPTPEEDDEDDDGTDTPTPTPTDNDGIDTPTPTDNDGIDTPTPTTTDNDGIDTPATVSPATVSPATVSPATVSPATVSPATVSPATVSPATVSPATVSPATVSPATVSPATVSPATVSPATVSPATVSPATVSPATVSPATVSPATVSPATVSPATVSPATVSPATVSPATVSPATAPTPSPVTPPSDRNDSDDSRGGS